MKITIAVIVMVLAGVGVGMSISHFEISSYETRFGDDEFLTADESSAGEVEQAQVVVVNGSEFDFGVMERNGTRSHRFEIKNAGTAPLRLEKGETTCKCTINKLVDGVLKPGESVMVELEWIAKEVGPDMVFMQTADIKTNDPARKVLRLTVRGDIITTVKVVPSPLVMSSIAASRGTEGEVLIYSYRTDNLDFLETTVDPELVDLIEAVVEPISSEELAEDKLAQSGKKLRIRLKPGLPLGALDQTVWLKTNLEDSPLVPVHFQGTVVSDIAIYGKRFDRTKNLFNLGRVSQKDGFRGELRILVRGEHRQMTKFQVVSVDPKDALEVKVQSKADTGSGKTVQHILEVAVPKDAPLVSRIGVGQGKLGQIVLSTTHPEVEKIVIKVSFEIID